MQKVGAKSGAVFPQAGVQVARSKIWDTKIAVWGRCRGRCRPLSNPGYQLSASFNRTRHKNRSARNARGVGAKSGAADKSSLCCGSVLLPLE